MIVLIAAWFLQFSGLKPIITLWYLISMFVLNLSFICLSVSFHISIEWQPSMLTTKTCHILLTVKMLQTFHQSIESVLDEIWKRWLYLKQTNSFSIDCNTHINFSVAIQWNVMTHICRVVGFKILQHFISPNLELLHACKWRLKNAGIGLKLHS